MLSSVHKLFRLSLWCLAPWALHAQSVTNCDPLADLPVTQGEVFFNAGSVTNSFSLQVRSSYTLGQDVVGTNLSSGFLQEGGFWSRFRLPPLAPYVNPTQGSFPDRVIVRWEVDPLSAEASNGFVVMRDGSFLAQVDKDIRQIIDFNVQAGEIYEYSVYGRNLYGRGGAAANLGFINPNGVVIGKVETASRNPVAGATVSLSPTLGKSLAFNGEDSEICISYQDPLALSQWTLSCWVKIGESNDKAGLIDFGSDEQVNFWLHTTPSSQGKGVVAGIGLGDASLEMQHVFAEDPEGWHYVVVTHSAGNTLLYVDGDFVGSLQGTPAQEPLLMRMGLRRDQTGYFQGNLDEVRILNRPFNSTEIINYKNITLSQSFPGLVAYWKFDEGMGDKVFDLSNNKIDGKIANLIFSSDTPDILNSGITNANGIYTIQGVNYNTVQTFSVVPSKKFYRDHALEFSAFKESQVQLPGISLPDSSTLELTFRPFDLQSRQTLLYNANDQWELYLEEGQVHLQLLGIDQVLGSINLQYQHVSLLMDATENTVKAYLNGQLWAELNYPEVSSDTQSNAWYLGSRSSAPLYSFTGLLDEFAIFQASLPQDQLQLHASPLENGGIDSGNPDLWAYYPFSEGRGFEVEDYGPFRRSSGQLNQAEFSILTFRQKTTDHIFRPSEQIININNSNTAATGIDFTDESTVTISGVVRFEGTFCYQDSVEILVNGVPAIPRIYTDAQGRFVGDFEPGRNVILTPKFGDHEFFPPFAEYRNLSRPIAGVLFQNTTKREIVGQMAGNEKCRLSIIGPNVVAKVKVQALNDCFEREITLPPGSGNYVFANLPPIPLNVVVTQHSNNLILDYFQNSGGSMVDLRGKEKDTVDFIYVSPPLVEIQPFLTNDCGIATIEQSRVENNYRKYTNNIEVYETYTGGRCYLDSFALVINNDIADASVDTVYVSDTTVYPLSYWAGPPNIIAPYLKNLQVTALVNGAFDSKSMSVVVLGERSREATFTTAAPIMPTLILRDPPGDASFARLREGTTRCQNWSNASLLQGSTNAGVTADFGYKLTVYKGTPFLGVIVEKELIAEVGFTATVGYETTSRSSGEVCITNDVEYMTSAGEDVMFNNADLYVGAAVNFEFSGTDVLGFDGETCAFTFGNNVRVNPESFGTQYIYSEWQILTDVIPSLELIGDTTSANSWRRIIEYNKELKEKATFVDNLSFDGLASITRSKTTSTTSAFEYETSFLWDTEFNAALGFNLFGAGIRVDFGFTIGGAETSIVGELLNEERTVSFTLADNDVGDNYSVDVLDDGVFGTPVFRIRAGESLCPWQPGTLNREEVSFNVDRQVAVNVPANSPATFRLTLGNIGQTGNDPIVYILGLKEGSNPDGAIVKVDGRPLVGDPIAFQIAPFSSIEVLLTIERGPIAYNYNNLGIFMASQCMWEHSRSLGYNLAGFYDSPNEPFQAFYATQDLRKFYKEFKLNVFYLEPCSPIDIGFPLEDWVVTPVDNNRLFITLNNYLNEDPDLEMIRVQYRRTGGDGAWINIIELPKDSLVEDPVFKIVEWDMEDLNDGPYEIRAITQCSNPALNPGISRVIKGRKETRPPRIFGTPQPSNGVLGPSDEISITFSKRINCDRIFPADGIGSNINLNNIALLDMTLGGILVDFIFSCSDDKIILVPNVPNRFIENHTLRAVVNEIEDLYGNASDYISWDFFVNRSNLYWVGGNIDEVINEGESLVVTREIRNQSGQVTSFTLNNIPSWVEVFPREGSVVPGGSQVVRFTFPSDLIPTYFERTLEMTTIDGIEPLVVGLRVACLPPKWNFDPNQYSHSMNMTLQLDIEGLISEDRLDHIAAFIDDELRGKGFLQYDFDLDKALVFLTIHGNQEDFGKPIRFRIWDASDCLVYGPTLQSGIFVADDLIGSPSQPFVISTQNLLLSQIQLQKGWNWISYNIDLGQTSVDSLLSDLNHPSNGTFRAQSWFYDYSNLQQKWVGPPDSMPDFLSMYQLRVGDRDSILLVGRPIDPYTPIPIVKGFNWVGFLPQRPLPLTYALQSLNPLDGDVIRGQFTFAQFVPALGWVGNLRFLSPLNGYILRITSDNPNPLIYPEPFNFSGNAEEDIRSWAPPSQSDLPFEFWTVRPQDFEYSMNAVAVVSADSVGLLLQEGDEVGAFYQGQVRGSSKAVFIEGINQYLLFLTLYANQQGEQLSFKYHRSATQEILDLEETLVFQSERLVGRVDQPFVFHLAQPTSVQSRQKGDLSLFVHPNPARDFVYLQWHAAKAGEATVQLYDMRGQCLQTHVFGTSVGSNTLHVPLQAAGNEGMYLLALKTEEGHATRLLKITN